MKKLSVALLLAGISAVPAVAWETPTMGWSSWNAFGHKINEEIIRSQADAMVSTGLDKAGYKYINIDDGAWCGRDESGNLVIHPTRFPNGLRPLVDYIHSLGLKAGTYSDAGYNTCASFWGGDKDGIGTGFYGHDAQDARFMFIDLNFDFIKVDFCGGVAGHNSDGLDLDERERYTSIGKAIEATGRTDVRYNLCRWAYPGTWAEDISTSWRMSQDIYLGWESVKDIIHQNLYLSAYAREGKYNDMDMLEVGRGMSVEEDKTHMGMWCMMSSPLLIGCDLREIDDSTIALLSNNELVAINQDRLGLQATVAAHKNGTYVLVKDFGTLRGTTRVVALYNPDDVAKTIEVDFRDIDLDGNVRVRDVFEKDDIGTFTGSYSTVVPAHGTRIYRCEADKRLERIIYEAETGRIEAYQELKNNQVVKSGIYEENDLCSGGAKASWLGARADNSLSWTDVYSEEGGDYEMTVYFISGADRKIDVTVNGTKTTTLTANSGAWDRVGSVAVKVTLKAGENVITLSNDTDWMPDIDYMTLLREGDLSLYIHQFEIALREAQGTSLAGIPAGLAAYFTAAIDALRTPASSREAYTEANLALKNIVSDIENTRTEAARISALLETAQANALATEDGPAAERLSAAIASVSQQFQSTENTADLASIETVLKEAMKQHLTAEDAAVRHGMSWDASILINNGTFDHNTSGWSGSPAWGACVAEHWNKTFSTFQTVSGLKNGHYIAGVQALYRRAANDGGTLYRSGSEPAPALFKANGESRPVTSLYAHPLSEIPALEAALSGTHVLKGYVNSMFGAASAFEKGLYSQSLMVEVPEGTLRIGLECTSSLYDCWCCFDNFTLTYLGTESSGIETVMSEPDTADVYNLAGICVRRGASVAEVKSLPSGLYIVNGRKVFVR